MNKNFKNLFSIVIGLIFIVLLNPVGLTQEKKTVEEKEEELLDFSSIQKVLESDGLEQERVKKQTYIKKIKVEKKKIELKRYQYPSEDDFWGMMSELWLVKNAQLLNWDAPRPEYGIGVAFKGLLEKLGYYNKSFKILIINTPTVVHMALPGKRDETIFLLSLPFIRGLDLTKVDIALLLLEDFFRNEQKYFIQNLEIETTFIGTNFYETKLDKTVVPKILENYTKVVNKTGFNFQQQYTITKKMDSVLKSTPSIWNAYFKMIQKIDQYIKSDLLYKDYLKIYPSPELQIKWLSPKKKII